MTYGIGIIVYNDKEDNLKIAFSTQFKGGMYAEEYGQGFLELIKDVKDKDTLLQAMKSFSAEHYEYYHECYESNPNENPDMLICSPDEALTTTDFSEIKEEHYFYQDYVYLNNLSNKELKYGDFRIKSNEIAVIRGLYENEICNNMPGYDGFLGLEMLEDVKRTPRNVEWGGNIYIELFPFTQKTCDEVLITDPADPNYVGSFKDIKKQYFDYLQAKGSGKDINSPITFFNLKNENDRNRAVSPDPYFNSRANYNVIISADRKVNLKSEGLATVLDYALPQFRDIISADLYDGKTSGSFFFNELVFPDDKDLEDINSKLYNIKGGYFVHLEPVPKLNKLFIEIQNKETKDCLFSFDYKYNPLELDITVLNNPDNIFNETDIIKEIKERIECYEHDKDYDEFQKEKYNAKGRYYERYIEKNEDTSDINLNPEPEVDFTSYLKFRKSDLNQTNYYALCNTDKITFKEFKETQKLPLYFLNQRTLDEIREKALTYTHCDFECPDYHTDTESCPLNNRTVNICFLAHFLSPKFSYRWVDTVRELIGKEKFGEVFDKLLESGTENIKTTIDMGESIKYFFDEDIAVFDCKDYGDTVGGLFTFRNTEFEFDYDMKTSDITLQKFDYDTEDNETGYYKEEELPVLLQNKSIQDLLFDQIDLEVNNFIAEQRYGSLDDMLTELKTKATSTHVKSVA